MTPRTYPKVYLYKRIVQAKLFIDKNYSENIDLDNIANEAFFSKYYFIRLFKKAYNKTPHQYLTIVRIDKAKQLLGTGHSVTDACYLTGFESASSFTALFKHYTGFTPSCWQLQQTKNKADILALPLKFIPNCFAARKG